MVDKYISKMTSEEKNRFYLSFDRDFKIKQLLKDENE